MQIITLISIYRPAVVIVAVTATVAAEFGVADQHRPHVAIIAEADCPAVFDCGAVVGKLAVVKSRSGIVTHLQVKRASVAVCLVVRKPAVIELDLKIRVTAYRAALLGNRLGNKRAVRERMDTVVPRAHECSAATQGCTTIELRVAHGQSHSPLITVGTNGTALVGRRIVVKHATGYGHDRPVLEIDSTTTVIVAVPGTVATESTVADELRPH